MLPTPADLLALSLLGAVLGLDVVSFPQAMLSRPIVAATLAGAMVGQPAAGLFVGALLELVAIETLPFGASRYPEWGSAAVVGGVLYAGRADGGATAAAGALLFAVAATLLTAWAGGVTMVWLRRLNAALARRRAQALDVGSGRTVVGLQLLGMTADLVRGALVTCLALLVLQPLASLALARWSLPDPFAQGAVVAAAAAVAASAAWKLFHAVPRARALFAGGLVAGSLLLLVLR
jgi:PTS system mannose-specific IIC component